MVCFGIGTLPMMSGILLLGYHDKLKLKTSLRKLIPIVTFLFGAWILIRGLGFDIPFISLLTLIWILLPKHNRVIR